MSPHPEPESQAERCRRLEERVAELERRLEVAESRPPTLSLRALRISNEPWTLGWGLRPSPPRRYWMDQAPQSYQCLPLVMANQWGWQVICPTDLVVTWDGSPDRRGLRVEVDPRYAPVIQSQFGSGIVTFATPWLFRTSPGWNIILKGPGSRWKANCVPLEGVIETWWLNYPFTLNWKIIEPGTVEFAGGESLGQLVPVPHATFDEATAAEGPVDADQKTAQELLRWQAERSKRVGDSSKLQHHLYRKAEGIDEHLARLAVPPFAPDWPDLDDKDSKIIPPGA